MNINQKLSVPILKYSNDNSNNNDIELGTIIANTNNISIINNTKEEQKLYILMELSKNIRQHFRVLEEEQEHQNISINFKIIYISFLSIISLPFIITDLYYASTDNSCVRLFANRLVINLFTYLIVEMSLTFQSCRQESD